MNTGGVHNETPRYQLLGLLNVSVGGLAVRISRPRHWAVLAYLLLHANRVVSTDRLVEALWDGPSPSTARTQIQNDISIVRRNLRSAGSNLITTHPLGYVLACRADEVDVHEFTGEVRAAIAATNFDPERAVAGLRDALALWHGQALPGIKAACVESERRALEETRLHAYEYLFATELERGHHSAVVAELTALVDAHPTHETFAHHLMLALYRCGRQAEALDVARSTRRTLVNQLGINSGPALQELELAILRNDPVLVSSAREGPVTAGPPAQEAAGQPGPAQLPADISGFIGRRDWLDDLTALLGDGGHAGVPSSAVVITTIGGSAGVGKTALAIHWGHRTRDRFPDGQLYANMRGYSAGCPVGAAEVLGRFLRALDLPAEKIPTEMDESAALYRSLLANRRMLIILDNVRNADQVRPLLPGSPGCFVLITSRDRLDALVAIDGARRLDLDVLPLAEATALLSYLVGEDRVSAELTAAADLAALCSCLPLALRITAAQLAGRPGRLLAAQVTALRGDRLGALALDDDPSASVAHALDLSYKTLPADAAHLFRLLSLLPAPDLSVAAIAALVGLPPAQATVLVTVLHTAHLVTEPSPGRFGMHDLVRQYGLGHARTDESETGRQDAADRLLDWYADAAVSANRALSPSWQPLPWEQSFPPANPQVFASDTDAMEWLEEEHTALLALSRHAAEGSAPRVVGPIVQGQINFLMRTHRATTMVELSRLGFKAAEDIDNDEAQAAHAQTLGIGYSLLRQPTEAFTWYQRALALYEKCGHLSRVATTHANLGAIYSEVNQLADAVRHLHLSVEIARRIGDRLVESVSLGNLGYVYKLMRSWDLAESTLLEALAVQREAGNRVGECHAEGNLGMAYVEQGRFAEAQPHLEAGLRLAAETGDQLAIARNRLSLGDVCQALNAVDRARTEWQTALTIFVDLDHSDAQQARARLRDADRDESS